MIMKKRKTIWSFLLVLALIISVFPVVPGTKSLPARAAGVNLLKNPTGEQGNLQNWVDKSGCFYFKNSGTKYIVHKGTSKNDIYQDVSVDSYPDGSFFDAGGLIEMQSGSTAVLTLEFMDNSGKVLSSTYGNYRDGYSGGATCRLKKPSGATILRYKITSSMDQEMFYHQALGTDASPSSTTKPTVTSAPTASPTGGSSGNYGLAVGGIYVTDLNKNDILGDGKASYDPSTNTLYLKGVNITKPLEWKPNGANNAAGIYAGGTAVDNLKINLSGTNTITMPAVSGKSEAKSSGIASQNLSIEGSGTLKITPATITNCTGTVISTGINAFSLNHTGGTIIIDENGKASAPLSYGLTSQTGPYTISGDAKFTAYGATRALNTPKGIFYGSDRWVEADNVVKASKPAFGAKNATYDTLSKYKAVSMVAYSGQDGGSAGSGGDTGGDTGGDNPANGRLGRDFYLTIGKTEVTEANKSDIFGNGTASYDLATNTLYLKNINLTDTNHMDNVGDSDYQFAIHAYNTGLNIHLSGTNYIKLPAFKGKNNPGNIAMSIGGQLTVSGNGSLNITTGDCSGNGEGRNYGIDCLEFIHKGGEINIVAGKGDKSEGVNVSITKYSISGNAKLTSYGETCGMYTYEGIVYGADTDVRAGSSGSNVTVTGKNLAYDKINSCKYVEFKAGGSGSGGGSDAGGGTGGGSDTGGGTGGGTSVTQTTPKWKTKWTHNKDVLVVWNTGNTWVTIKAISKVAKGRSIKWIKNGRKAKIRWRKKFASGKYKFRATSKESGGWLSGTYTFTITCS